MYPAARLFLAFAAASFTTACGDNASVSPDAGIPGHDGPVVDASPDAPPDANPLCLAPITIPPDTNAQAAATTALQALDPAATLEWSDVRGTLTSISGLVVTLPNCTGTTDVYDQMFDVLAQTPALFQIDRNEWQGSVLPCSEVLSDGFHTVVIRRKKCGPYNIENDVFSAVANVQNGVVILRNFSGVYIPPPNAHILSTFQQCPDLSDTALTPVLRTPPFAYERFALPPAEVCTVAGNGSYTAMAADTLTIDPEILANWEESDVITLRRQRSATLVVDPSNYTVDLQSSSANCVDEDAMPHIGWIRTFNSVTGEILYDRATPDPFCTVCFH